MMKGRTTSMSNMTILDLPWFPHSIMKIDAIVYTNVSISNGHLIALLNIGYCIVIGCEDLRLGIKKRKEIPPIFLNRCLVMLFKQDLSWPIKERSVLIASASVEKNQIPFLSDNRTPGSIDQFLKILDVSGKIYLAGMKKKNFKKGFFVDLLQLVSVCRCIYKSKGLSIEKILTYLPDCVSPSLVESLSFPLTISQLRMLGKFVFLRNNYLLIIKNNHLGSELTFFQQLKLKLISENICCGDFYRYYVGTANTFVFLFKNIIVRMPVDNEGVIRCNTNKELLGHLSLMKPFKNMIPANLSPLIIGKYSAFVEVRLNGVEPSSKIVSKNLTDKAIELISMIHISTKDDNSEAEEQYENFLKKPFNFMIEIAKQKKCQTSTIENLFRSLEKCREIILESRIPFVLMHGDYKISNLLINKHGKINGIIDWDLGTKKGLPLVDILIFQSYNVFLKNRSYLSTVIAEDINKCELIQSNYLSNYLKEFRLTTKPIVQMLFMCAIVHYLTKMRKFEIMEMDTNSFEKHVCVPSTCINYM